MMLYMGGHRFEYHCDLIETTGISRPDTSWKFVDSHGHTHTWHQVMGGPYGLQISYYTPTLVWVKDGEEWWEYDDEPHAVGHLECKQCGDHVKPGYCADTNRQYMAGLKHFLIDGESVSEHEFRRRLQEAQNGSEESKGSGGQEAERGGPDKA